MLAGFDFVINADKNNLEKIDLNRQYKSHRCSQIAFIVIDMGAYYLQYLTNHIVMDSIHLPQLWFTICGQVPRC